MFTIKILRRKTIQTGQTYVDPDGNTGQCTEYLYSTIVEEAKKVSIYELNQYEAGGTVFEVAGEEADGKTFVYYISNPDKPRPTGFADEIEFGYKAYIENAAGKTTEVVGY
jgi:hypothetical protein